MADMSNEHSDLGFVDRLWRAIRDDFTNFLGSEECIVIAQLAI